MLGLLIIILFTILPLILFAIMIYCDGRTERRERQQQRRQQREQQRQQQQQGQEQPVAPIEINSSISSIFSYYRSCEGYVLESTMHPHIESRHVDDEESEVFSENPDPDVPSDILSTNGLSSHPQAALATTVSLTVDFGDFEVYPLNEMSCPICLVDYVHGETIQRNAIRGSDCNHSCTNPKQSVVNNQCDHMFHTHCIATWIESNMKMECPICRRLFVMGRPDDTVTC
jgi:type II secretory pathway pseudopilin PulG